MSVAFRFRFDDAALHLVLAEALVLAEKLPPEIVERLVRALDAGAELFVVETDGLSASCASEFIVRPKPSDGLLGFMSAARATNPDLRLVEDALRHIENSISCATEVEDAEEYASRPEGETSQ